MIWVKNVLRHVKFFIGSYQVINLLERHTCGTSRKLNDVLLDTVDLILKALLVIHYCGHVLLLNHLCLQIRFEWTSVRVVPFRQTAEAGHIEVLYLSPRVHHHNLGSINLTQLFLLTIGGFMTFCTTVVTSNLHEIILERHNLT